MAATLKLTHKAIGVEVRRGTYDVVLDGERVGSLEMNDTFETPVEAGRHTLQVRNGRNSSRTKTFDAADGEIATFRCTGKSILPMFPLSLSYQPGTLACSPVASDARSPLLLVSAVLGTAGRRRVDPSAGGGGTTSLDRRVPDRSRCSMAG